MNTKSLFILAIIIILMLQAPALANRAMLGKFTYHYDNSGTRLNVCKTCMDSASPPASLNSYGAEMRNFPGFDRGNPILTIEKIEQLDSDGDGFSNIEEITNSTFPGNSDDFPSSDSTVSEPAATNTIMNAMVTIIVILIVAFMVRMKK